MKVLVIGSGGREHALVWKLARSARIGTLLCAPGNAGIGELARLVDIRADEILRLRNFARREEVDLTVVGPEVPLAAGIVDEFEKVGLRAFGPTAAAAELEASKVFAKDLMKKHGIPTAGYRVFDGLEMAREWVEGAEPPVVVKADGLAAGKGVVVCRTRPEAVAAVNLLMKDRAYGPAGQQVLVEECLEGEECSILALVDGQNIYPLETSQDHKAVFDGDEGPNTGGMGAYSPAPVVDDRLMDRIVQQILVPVVHALNVDGRRFRGVLYAGLMLTKDGPKVLEFNVRFGDPEAQPLLFRLRSDLLDVLEAVVEGRLDEVELDWDPRPAICVVMTSAGYPGRHDKGDPISGLDEVAGDENVFVFHAGTARRGDRIVTAGGRVLGVTALGQNLGHARERAYEAVKTIKFEGAHYRRDIGLKALDR